MNAIDEIDKTTDYIQYIFKNIFLKDGRRKRIECRKEKAIKCRSQKTWTGLTKSTEEFR